MHNIITQQEKGQGPVSRKEIVAQAALFVVAPLAILMGAIYYGLGEVDRSAAFNHKRAKYGREILKVINITAHSAYFLALPYLTQDQTETFQLRLNEVDEVWEDADRQYNMIMADVAFVALRGITIDDAIDTRTKTARDKMISPELDTRQKIILELHLLVTAVAAHRRTILASRTTGELERAYTQFQRAKNLIDAMLMKYSELYLPTPTH